MPFHDVTAAPVGRAFLSLPMAVMEELSAAGVTGPSRIDRPTLAASLDGRAFPMAHPLGAANRPNKGRQLDDRLMR